MKSRFGKLMASEIVSAELCGDEIFGKDRRKSKDTGCMIGSVKANNFYWILFSSLPGQSTNNYYSE